CSNIVNAILVSISLALRVRPLTTEDRLQPRYRNKSENDVIAIPPPPKISYQPNGSPTPQQITVIPLQKSFTFDYVFGPQTQQEEIYERCAKRLILKFLEGAF